MAYIVVRVFAILDQWNLMQLFLTLQEHYYTSSHPSATGFAAPDIATQMNAKLHHRLAVNIRSEAVVVNAKMKLKDLKHYFAMITWIVQGAFATSAVWYRSLRNRRSGGGRPYDFCLGWAEPAPLPPLEISHTPYAAEKVVPKSAAAWNGSAVLINVSIAFTAAVPAACTPQLLFCSLIVILQWLTNLMIAMLPFYFSPGILKSLVWVGFNSSHGLQRYTTTRSTSSLA